MRTCAGERASVSQLPIKTSRATHIRIPPGEIAFLGIRNRQLVRILLPALLPLLLRLLPRLLTRALSRRLIRHLIGLYRGEIDDPDLSEGSFGFVGVL